MFWKNDRRYTIKKRGKKAKVYLKIFGLNLRVKTCSDIGQATVLVAKRCCK